MRVNRNLWHNSFHALQLNALSKISKRFQKQLFASDIYSWAFNSLRCTTNFIRWEEMSRFFRTLFYIQPIIFFCSVFKQFNLLVLLARYGPTWETNCHIKSSQLLSSTSGVSILSRDSQNSGLSDDNHHILGS